MPRRIDRYRIERLVGKGGFGLVFLAHDEELDRFVAIKIPHARHLSKPGDAEEYVVEARTVASLDHPNIVPVFDVGRTEEFPCYIVSKYVDGINLTRRLRAGRFGYYQAAALVATVAEALHHAHKQGIIHRDVKPGNILIGPNDKPYVVDFGLALKEENVGRGPRYAGSPTYMSPEQARGEGHRVDGRSDIYSLGAVFYEMLTGRRTFSGDSKTDLMEQIAFRETKPPRQIDDRIPKDLERICLKALAKLASERYTTALDLAEDLRIWLADHPGDESGGSSRRIGSLATGADSAGTSGMSTRVDTRSDLIRIVPKGLRSFDEHDAEFFLELLPGARDREGFPESLRFWKNRVEETDSDATFPVGLIYGPSGCGKSSLVKAGLLPRLADHVISVYAEAAPDDTETRLLRGLRKRCPRLDESLGLKQSLAALRRGEGVPEGAKILIVLDQFEQWLHGRKIDANADLVQALRQCDGGRTQCILMVRDDFWLAVSRFFRQLEIRLVEGHNSHLADLFDPDHARKVLAAFGRACGRLPEVAREMTREQQDFLRQSVAGLAEGGKVNCVRLALFSEMMKGKPWTTASLREVGGTQGVGVTFLEETFVASTAPPEHRLHQAAARDVLGALLPDSGADIKGERKSREQLLDASGYADSPRDFDELIRILDRELRLITPADPDGIGGAAESSAGGDQGPRYYQLTHDDLVVSLRDWLTRGRRETRRGRAELRLAERSAEWNVRPENRHLPTWWEYVNIVAFTHPRNWSEAERRMMKRAGRVLGVRAGVGLALVLSMVLGIVTIRDRIVESHDRARVDGLVRQLFIADVAEWPDIVSALEKQAELSVPRLSAVADDEGRSADERLRATLALADRPGPHASRLIDYAVDCDVHALAAIRERVTPFASRLEGELWRAERENASNPSARLHLAALLASADPAGERWSESAPSVVSALLSENSLDCDIWAELLRPAAPALIPSLKSRFFDDSATSADRVTSARVLSRYADAELLTELIFDADAAQFSLLFPAASRHGEALIDVALQRLRPGDVTTDDQRIRRAKRWRNAAVVLLRIGRADEVQSLLTVSPDPTARTLLMLEMRDFGVRPADLVNCLDAWQDPIARQAILLALQPYRGQELTPALESAVVRRAEDILREGSHQGERSAAVWLLRSWDHLAMPEQVTRENRHATPPSVASLGDRNWWINSQGQTMTIVAGPATFEVGSPTDEHGRGTDEHLREVTIDYRFAVSIHEVTMDQFRSFDPAADFTREVLDDPRCPANRVSFTRAMAYCRWLSEQEDMPPDQMCYPPVSEIRSADAILDRERLMRRGYRLLTEEEWEYVARAGSRTRWHSGADQEQLFHFAWFGLNSDDRVKAVGMLRPNPWGLFDVIGNVSEWCHSSAGNGKYVLRGGNVQWSFRHMRSAQRYLQSNTGYSFTGLRIARTVAPAEE